MTAGQRDALSSAAIAMLSEVQTGSMSSLRMNSIQALANNFSTITTLADTLTPQLEHASLTVDHLYLLDAPKDSLSAEQTDFYCGTPVVALTFTHLPPGTYALVILHATGVKHPQQIALILSEATPHHWMLGGFYSKPLLEADHDGIWYWVLARRFSQQHMLWNALLYYQTAAYLVEPVDFLSSPNIDKLQNELALIHPEGFPASQPLVLSTDGSQFQITMIDVTTIFGPLDLEIHYTPDATQQIQLRDPVVARRQVMDVMTALLALHPELRQAFHGVWVQADGASSTLFSLELPMDQITSAFHPLVTSATPVIHP